MKTTIRIALTLLSVSARLAVAQQAGSLDLTFNPGTGADGPISCVAIQTNGQIVIGGSFQNFNGQPNNGVVRLNSDGSLDTTFNIGQGPNSTASCVAIQTNGEIVIGGSFSQVNGIIRPKVARLRSDGSLDIAFAPPLVFPSLATLTFQNDGRILCGGGDSPGQVLRLNANGTLDTNFNFKGELSSVSFMAVQPNGQILVGGGASLARLNSDGSLDPTFNQAPVNVGGLNCLALTPSGQIMVGGSVETLNGYTRQGVARLNADGSLDTTFVPPLSAARADVSCLAVQPDGKCLIAATTNSASAPSSGPYCTRLTSTGAVDPSFSLGTTGGPNSSLGAGGYPTAINAIALQPDGRILVAGTFSSFNGTNVNCIVRLNGDSSVPAPFQLLSPALYMGMLLSGVVGTTNRIEATSSLTTNALWTPLFDVVLQTNLQFIVDPTPAIFPSRFYRAVQIP